MRPDQQGLAAWRRQCWRRRVEGSKPFAESNQVDVSCAHAPCRPHHETLKAYIRKLSALVLEVVQQGGKLEQAGAKAQGEVRGCRRCCWVPTQLPAGAN